MFGQGVFDFGTGGGPLLADELEDSVRVEGIVESFRFQIFGCFFPGGSDFSGGKKTGVTAFDESLAAQVSGFFPLNGHAFLEAVEEDDVREGNVGSTDEEFGVFGVKDTPGDGNGDFPVGQVVVVHGQRGNGGGRGWGA